MVDDLCLFCQFSCLCHPCIPLNFHGIFLFTCVYPFFLCSSMHRGNVCECKWSSIIHYVIITRAGAARTPAAHCIILRCVVYAKCANGVCIVVGLTVSLERTLVTVDYEEKRKSQYAAPDKTLLFRVKIVVVASKCRGARPAEERTKSYFQPMLTCRSRKLCVNVLSIFEHKSIR